MKHPNTLLGVVSQFIKAKITEVVKERVGGVSNDIIRA